MEGTRILISEDDSSVRRVLARVFDQAGFDVTAMPNGLLALEALRASAEDRRFDVMVTDINMPEMTGRQLCEHIAEHGPYIPDVTFVVTSRTEREEREWVSALPGVRVIEKPIGPRNLLRLVKERLLAGVAEGPDREPTRTP
ncbi:MAG: response regulator [Candidatus Eisenbacteria bacterium]